MFARPYAEAGAAATQEEAVAEAAVLRAQLAAAAERAARTEVELHARVNDALAASTAAQAEHNTQRELRAQLTSANERAAADEQTLRQEHTETLAKIATVEAELRGELTHAKAGPDRIHHARHVAHPPTVHRIRHSLEYRVQ